MFHDRFRLPIAAVCVAWLVFMGVRYTDVVTSRVSWIEQCTADKLSCDGRRVFLALSEVVALEEHAYTVRKLTVDHRIDGDPTGLTVGETISVVGRFDAANDQLVETERHAHPWRPWKVGLGYAGLVLALAAALFGIRVRGGRLVSRG